MLLASCVRMALSQWILLATVIVSSTLLLPEPATGQACSSCRLVVEKETELSSAAGAVVPSMAVSVAALDRRFFVSYLFQNPQIVAFDRSGRLLEIYDRRGAGPGELERAPLLVGVADTLYAVYGQRAILMSADLQSLNTRRFGLRLDRGMVILQDGNVVVADEAATANGEMFSLHLLDAAGQVVRGVQTVPAARASVRPVLARAHDDGFWSAWPNGSDLVEWHPSGTERLRLAVDRDWFAPWSDEVAGAPFTARPRSRTSAISAVTDDRLLLLTWVADADWAPVSAGSGPAVFRPAELDLSKLHDTVVELVDVNSGAVLARRTLPQHLEPVQGTTDRFFSTRQVADGHVIVDVWRIRLIDVD